jgi:hypothetical protein
MLLDFQSHVSYICWHGDEATRQLIKQSAFDLQKEQEIVLCPDCPWYFSSFLSSGYLKLVPRLQSDGGVKLLLLFWRNIMFSLSGENSESFVLVIIC